MSFHAVDLAVYVKSCAIMPSFTSVLVWYTFIRDTIITTSVWRQRVVDRELVMTVRIVHEVMKLSSWLHF